MIYADDRCVTPSDLKNAIHVATPPAEAKYHYLLVMAKPRGESRIISRCAADGKHRPSRWTPKEVLTISGKRQQRAHL